MTDYTQWTSTAKTYFADHLDEHGNHLPVLAKPAWTIESRPEDPNVRQVLATLETSVDGTSARITTHDQPGVLMVGVSAQVAPNAVARKEFTIAVRRHQPVMASAPTFKITQSRNGSIAH